MHFDPGYTARWYDQYGAKEWERWERSALMTLQYEVYMHHLRRLIKPGDKVLDAGCGVGRFTRELVELGAQVTALDLSPKQIELCREKAPGATEYVVGSITSLSRYESHTFDVVLALGGPLSYCFEEAETALSELGRVTKPGGTVMLSVMNLFGTLHTFMAAVLAGDPAANEQWLVDGILTRELNDGHECKLYRESELRQLLNDAGLIDIDIQASGWLTALHKLELPERGSARWTYLLKAELEASRECPAAGTHLIAFGRRPVA